VTFAAFHVLLEISYFSLLKPSFFFLPIYWVNLIKDKMMSSQIQAILAVYETNNTLQKIIHIKYGLQDKVS